LEFEQEFQRRNFKVREKYKIIWYPHNIKTILSDNWFWNDDHIPSNKNLILVVWVDKDNKNKSATCLAQIYNDKQIWLESWYAVFTTFPITEIEGNHPINLVYKTAIWNKDILENNNENKKNIKTILEKLWLWKEIEINEANYCITNDEIISAASYQEIQRRKERNTDLKLDDHTKMCQEFAQKKWYNLEQKLN
jgi:uncharacterized protein (UPF0371 family)